jgi:hypothetical protein
MLAWRKAERSAENGNCVEVSSCAECVGFRDSKNPTILLLFSPRAAKRFIVAVKSGKLG